MKRSSSVFFCFEINHQLGSVFLFEWVVPTCAPCVLTTMHARHVLMTDDSLFRFTYCG